ncbi:MULTISPECIES: hypothetical protein [Carboxydocella]|uniref:Uncharacterized protein n=2 Tax=Carboxydocella TaxID=178898 RepID=A0A1T4SKF6_9FIRM|nr:MULTISPECIES: hypothetical protein [Carboxydocella]AVX19459.1 hypothetical protein CFE_0260 [Carboxydocella thermautotrophica]AVX29876.1 hypothetical protein CTH_0267 [Carboxydocella thermautotrophica]SKA28331.1 hypothetical protein SAMN02745885_02720 [Carboxydocella sporoproducens DSM 16521]GAW29060.1 hypothetical protein ULO1_16300 [Carboxydocella sp. ULO1]GAW31612.1 hypothetical protein JDF658_13770 [Carboxydocella sp. JDF658]
MELECKCGFLHVSMDTLITKREPISGKRRIICSVCGKQIPIRTVQPKTFKDLMRQTGGSGYNANVLFES